MALKAQALQKSDDNPQEIAAQLNKTMQQGNKARQLFSNVITPAMVPQYKEPL
jgi:hypothetical protein